MIDGGVAIRKLFMLAQAHEPDHFDQTQTGISQFLDLLTNFMFERENKELNVGLPNATNSTLTYRYLLDMPLFSTF